MTRNGGAPIVLRINSGMSTLPSTTWMMKYTTATMITVSMLPLADDIPPGVQYLPVIERYLAPGFAWTTSSPEARLRVVALAERRYHSPASASIFFSAVGLRPMLRAKRSAPGASAGVQPSLARPGAVQ